MLPRHIGIIMDGNGRWAARRGRPRVFGHRAGAEAVRRTVRCCGDLGIQALTLYAFSTENWSRPKAEVSRLMQLLGRFLRSETPELAQSGVRLRFLGDPSRLSPALQKEMAAAVRKLEGGSGLRLNLAVNYGGRDEITRAARALAAEAAAGRLRPEDVTEDTLAERLDTDGLPEVDLVIRTAGEMRVSNFLLWQGAYAEYWATDLCWPDFGPDALREAIEAYQKRERRFGGA